jgi:hypothetical protein
VRELLSRAPRIAGWEFYEYRPAESMDWAERNIEGRTGGTLEGVSVTLRPGEHNLVNLTYLVPSGWSDDHAAKVAFVATESLLGEEALDRWIGAVDHSANLADDLQPIPLSGLREAVDGFVGQVCDALPDKPWYAFDLDAVNWSSLRMQRERADDYEGQSDMFVCITPALPVMQNVLGSYHFDSMRHSRCGETFCYLKFDRAGGPEDCEFSDREAIEEAINETLRPLALGTSIGGGTGFRYMYVELALVDVDAAWQALRSRLAEARFTNRTWLLFHDAYLSAEWRGLSHDTPEPYRKPRETEE